MASDESHSYWGDPKAAAQWEAARLKLRSGQQLIPPNEIPVIVAGKDDTLVLKQIAGLMDAPDLKSTPVLNGTKTNEPALVTVCSISDDVIPRLDGWLDRSSQLLVELNGKPRYARKFEPYAKPWNLSVPTKNSTKPVRVLSLGDGTDCALTAQLDFVKVLMRETTPGLKPCDAFDLIGGIGIGGVCALILGKLGQTVDVCFDYLNRISRNDNIASLVLLSEPQSTLLEDLEGKYPSINANGDQRTFIVANVKKRQDEVLLRSYFGPDPTMLSEKSEQLEAMLATASVVHRQSVWYQESIQLLKYFRHEEWDWQTSPSLVSTSREQPSSATNDPIYHAYREARGIWPDREIRIASFMPEPKRDLPGDKAHMEIRGFRPGDEGLVFRAVNPEEFAPPSFSAKAKAFWADEVF